jgi:amidase
VAKFNESLNAIVTLNPTAIDEAHAIDQRVANGETLPLAGVPVGIKDVTPVAGLRTTYGSPFYTDHVPYEDALVVTRLRQAGAVIIGKTNTPEFAAGGNTWNDIFGRTRNPWDPTKSAGGSTGGGAVGLATGMIALAEGTDLGGSLRIPASFCGVTGLRPSPGLVPTHPSDWVWDTLQVTGPMARTSEDVALMLQAIAGPSPHSPLRQPAAGRDFVGAARSGPQRSLRLAYCPDIAGIGVDPGVEKVCRDATAKLADEGHAVEEIELDFGKARDAFLSLRGYWFVSHMFERLGHIEEFGINVRNNTKAGLNCSTAELGAAERVRSELWHRFRVFFESFDHLLTPTMCVPPFPVEQNYPETVAGRTMKTYVDWLAPTFLLSLTGLPVGSVPCGLDAGGMPVGLQVVGRPEGEEAVLALMSAVQAVAPVGAPPLTKTKATL